MRSVALILALAGLAAACSSSSGAVPAGPSGTPDGGGGPLADASSPGEDAASDAGDQADVAPHPDAGVPDPTQPGPYSYAETDGSYTSPVDGSSIPIHVAYPKAGGPKAGPYPVIVFARGFLIDPSEYYSYIQRAASFGYVGIAAKYPISTTDANYPNNVKDILAGLDWLAAQTAAPLGGLADTTLVGMSGHSLGGKLSILAAAKDSRIKAALTFDAVDGSANCSTPANCPDAAKALPLAIPTGFLGETLDGTASSGFSQACAPASANFATIYPQAGTPSLEVTVLGAGHVSFLDNLSACGFFCGFCATPKMPQDQALNLSHTYLVSFYERYLRGITTYDAYLTGALTDTLFVSTGQATIVAK